MPFVALLLTNPSSQYVAQHATIPRPGTTQEWLPTAVVVTRPCHAGAVPGIQYARCGYELRLLRRTGCSTGCSVSPDWAAVILAICSNLRASEVLIRTRRGPRRMAGRVPALICLYRCLLLTPQYRAS